jgi:hypothetical protein
MTVAGARHTNDRENPMCFGFAIDRDDNVVFRKKINMFGPISNAVIAVGFVSFVEKAAKTVNVVFWSADSIDLQSLVIQIEIYQLIVEPLFWI